jgi:methionyl-tRNA formyltransferase
MSDTGSPRIVFAGTPDFAVPPLQALIDAGFKPVAVYTQPDRPSGRGRRIQASAVKHAATAAGIDVRQPRSLKEPESHEALRALEPDLLIVVAYGLILPAQVLTIPIHGCWNIHASLLPRWRGAAPIQRAIEAGDRESGVCIMQMDEGLDTGPVLKCIRVPLAKDETGGSLHDRLATAGAGALLDCVHALAAGKAPRGRPQPEEGVTYARKLDKNEARIDWSLPASTLSRKVRAFNPWPVAWCLAGGERTRIWMADHASSQLGEIPGKVLSSGREGIEVATGEGILRLLELQRAGKRRMDAFDYLNAGHLPGHFE